MKYEYRIETTGYASIETGINEAAAEGWRVVSVFPGTASSPSLKVLLEREIEPELSPVTQAALEAVGQGRLAVNIEPVPAPPFRDSYCDCGPLAARALGRHRCLICLRPFKVAK